LLEPRRLLASDWTNPNRPGDVDGNGFAFPLDALVVLNQLASNQRLGLGSSLPDLDDQQPPPYFDVNGDNTITPLDALLVLNIIAKSPAVPEVLSVALQADTGPFGSLNSDQITSRAVIVGRAIDPDNPLASVEARVNDGAFQPITFDSLGQFVFETGLLLDGTNDGIHSVAIRATDQTNRVSPQTEFSFTLDTTAPQSPTLELAPAFVLGSPQNQQTSNDVVTLRGITSPGARLRLGTGSAEITAASDGRFEFTSVPLSLGANTLTVIASDLAGNLAETTVTITRIADRVGPELNINGPLTRLTNANITVSGTIGESATLLFGQIDLGDVFEIPITGGTFTFNTTLPTNGNADGQHLVRLRAEDARGNQSPLATVVWTLDTVAPVASTDFTGTVRSQSSLLPIVFNEPLAPSSLVAASYTLSITSGPRAGQTIAIQSLRQEAGNRVVLVLPQAMENVSHRLQLGSGVIDAAGNRPSTTVFDFTVAQPTRLRESSPANGEEMVSLTRETIIRFDNEVDPATITPESFYLIANGERVAGRIRVSATERFATFFYDNPLPASTGVRIMVDGNLIRGRDGLPLDADNDGEPGGILQADFRTLPLTFIPGTSVWGYVYDSYNTVPQERSPIAVPTVDPQFDPNSTGTATISFARAEFFPTTGQSTSDPRLQPNKISSVIDANVVYGSDELRARALRRIDGSGKLKTTVDNLLPLNNATFFPNGELPVDNKGTFANSSLPVAGDIRAAASPALAVVHTLFVREHNRKADEIKAANPKFSDELIYQEARRWVSALIQQITYQEYLPSLVGPNSLAMYTGYKPNIDPSVGALFSTAAFRLGHTQQGSVVPRLDANGQAWPDGDLGLREAFFNPTPVEADGIDPFLRGLIASQAQEIDLKVVDDLRNFLFGAPGSGGMDLAAINSERGRDLGLPSYNQAREDFGLTKVTTFAQITSNAQVAAALTSLYGSVDQVDAWVGGLAENHVAGGAVGPLFAAIIKDQFLRSRDGDRFWYENSQLSQADLTAIRNTTLSDVIERNSGLTGVAANVFTTATAPTGPAAGGSAATRAPSEYPTYDGYGNNVANPLQGRAGQPLLTSTTIGYSDGQSSPAGADRPGTRSISNALFAQPAPTLNTRGLTELSVTWGQFIAHDFSLTPAQSTKGTDIPVVGATIFLDADASVFATTDQFGFFELTTPAGMPAPDFFVHIDGSTAVNAPADAKYATLGKPFHSIPGQRIQLKMAGTPFDVYLPPMSMSDIVTLNPTTDTEVGFGPAAQAEIRAMFADDPAKAQLIIDTMRVTYPAGSAQSESGVPATRATIIPVSPDRLPAPLPPGANPGLVISVQAGTDAGFNLAGGSTNFDVPAPISFPNLEALSPGEVTLLWSFDHDAGDWVVAGTATVQPNRDSVMSDNGNGILAPGWHFIERGVRVRANPFVEDPDENDKCDPTSQALKALALQAVAGAFSGLPGTGSYATDHLFDFLNGNGSPKLYGPNSGPATDIQGTPAFQREAAKLLDGLASAIAANNGQNGFPTSIPDYSTTTSSMGFYPFGNFPGTQASAAIGGVGPAGVQVSNININPDGTFTADVEYAIKDRYSFSDDRGKSLFDNYANDLELCGFASPFDVDVKIRQSISGQATSGQTAPEGEDGDNSLNISLATAYATNRIFEFDGSKLSISTSGVGEFEFQSRNATGPQFASISLGSSPSPFFRSSTSSTGSGLQEVVLRENTSYTLRVLNLRNQYNGEVSFNTGTGGTILTLGKIKISPDLQRIDTDGDGLSDFAETVVGTNSRSADSDGDGLSDFAELEQGLSPLSGLSFPTGVIASISVMGETKESVVAVSGASRIGYIATGSHGLAITDLTNTDQPIMLGQLSLQGDSQDIDVDSLTSTAIVASGEGGLHFVDVSDPMLPRHVRTVNINATQVQLLDGVAYASSGSRISAYDPSSGDLLSAYSIPDSGLITGLAHEGNFIYAIDAVLKLHVLEVGRFQVL